MREADLQPLDDAKDETEREWREFGNRFGWELTGWEHGFGGATFKLKGRYNIHITLPFRESIEAAFPTPDATITSTVERDQRQRTVAEWCAAAFGGDQASSIEQRGIRLLEEAIEAYQSCGASADMAHKMVDYIFARPAGTVEQELGGVGVTTLALANAAGLSADQCEAKEVARVLAKPLSHFAARNQAKNDAGFRALAPRSAAPTADGEVES